MEGYCDDCCGMGEHVCAEQQHDTDQFISPGRQTKLIRRICGKMNETASWSHGRKIRRPSALYPPQIPRFALGHNSNLCSVKLATIHQGYGTALPTNQPT